MISGMTNKKMLKQLAGALISYPPPPATGITVTHHDIKASPSFSMPPTTPSTSDLLDIVNQQIDVTVSAIDVIKHRQKILQQAIARSEASVLAAVIPNGDGTTSKKKNKMTVSRPINDDRPCGWEPRLIWDDEDVKSWYGEIGDDEGCILPRKRCERHQG